MHFIIMMNNFINMSGFITLTNAAFLELKRLWIIGIPAAPLSLVAQWTLRREVLAI